MKGRILRLDAPGRVVLAGLLIGAATLMSWVLAWQGNRLPSLPDGAATGSPENGSFAPQSVWNRADSPPATGQGLGPEPGLGLGTPGNRLLLAGESAAQRIAALRAEIDERIASGEKGWPSYRRLLQELVEIGTEEAIACVLELMEDERIDFTRKAETFAEVLQNVADPRIGPSAARALRVSLTAGLTSGPDCDGYLLLAARKGGLAAAELVVSILEEERGQVQGTAAGLISTVEAHPQLLPRILEAARSNPVHASAIFAGLGSWENPNAMAAIREIVLDPGATLELRCPAAEAAGRYAPPADVVHLVSTCRDRSSPENQTLALAMLRGALKNDSMDGATFRAAGAEIVRDALQSEDPTVWREAVWLVRDSATLQTEETAAWLEALQGRLEDQRTRQKIQAVLRRIRSRR
ncbi:MAG: hypothetical protein AB1726_03315 [Planctomycetota bacterium]